MISSVAFPHVALSSPPTANQKLNINSLIPNNIIIASTKYKNTRLN